MNFSTWFAIVVAIIVPMATFIFERKNNYYERIYKCLLFYDGEFKKDRI